MYRDGRMLEDRQFQKGQIRFFYLTGVIKASQSMLFRKLIFRISRGNTYFNLFDLETEPIEDLQARKERYQVYFIVCQWGQ